MTEYEEGRLLFKDGDWELRNRGRLDPHYRGTRIWHRCSDNWWYVWTTTPVCCRCGQSPPTELIGLKALQDWNR